MLVFHFHVQKNKNSTPCYTKNLELEIHVNWRLFENYSAICARLLPAGHYQFIFASEMIGSITRGCSRRCIPAAASSALDFYPSLVASNHSLRTMTTGGLSTLRLTAWCGKIAGAKRRGLSPLARGYSSSMASFASHGILERMRSVLGYVSLKIHFMPSYIEVNVLCMIFIILRVARTRSWVPAQLYSIIVRTAPTATSGTQVSPRALAPYGLL